MKLNRSSIINNVSRNIDVRGEILSIVDDRVQNVSIITCNPGSIRSNHYHLKDFHYMYVLTGEIDYFFKEIGSNEISYLNVKTGENIFTPPMEIHATYFPKKTTLIVSSLNPRDQETYENDTVRVDFVNESNIKKLLENYSKF
jgi:oxalate decarboxylase/phosphoglucose isomerase-like protein (cupin superfamily)|tara:strand:- start:7477 stop:7905 length:429 start_codon:yes stop_codon:yes gene_type:complete